MHHHQASSLKQPLWEECSLPELKEIQVASSKPCKKRTSNFLLPSYHAVGKIVADRKFQIMIGDDDVIIPSCYDDLYSILRLLTSPENIYTNTLSMKHVLKMINDFLGSIYFCDGLLTMNNPLISTPDLPIRIRAFFEKRKNKKKNHCFNLPPAPEWETMQLYFHTKEVRPSCLEGYRIYPRCIIMYTKGCAMAQKVVGLKLSSPLRQKMRTPFGQLTELLSRGDEYLSEENVNVSFIREMLQGKREF